MLPTVFDFATLQAGYRDGRWTPRQIVDEVLRRAEGGDPTAWISRYSREVLHAAADALGTAPRSEQPLWGIPFAVKDNIDCTGLPTTAACPAFAHMPGADATVVAQLRAAGALVIGKTNLDQFATGLNGTRSPYGAPRSVFDARYISGGSSSGSAVAVAAGQVSFALGTDTAGSGRIPAAFNNLVGIKPTRGLLSNRGLVPACRSLDCITVFALNVADAHAVLSSAAGRDEADPYSRTAAPRDLPRQRLRIGVLSDDQREFHGDAEAAQLYAAAIAVLATRGASTVEFDYRPFRKVAALLYEGPWPAERYAAIENFFTSHGAEIEPTVRQIIGAGAKVSGAAVFSGMHELERLRRICEREWESLDVLLLPTAPTIYTVEQLRAEPVLRNSELGRYTNFVNLLDYSALALPAGFRTDGLPFGVTLIAPAHSDNALARFAADLHPHIGNGQGIDRRAIIPNSGLSP